MHSFFDAAWWSASTITTVGYGDLAPVTAAGRLVGVFTMVVGISAFAVVTAKIAEFLVISGRDAPEPPASERIAPPDVADVTSGSASPRAPRPS